MNMNVEISSFSREFDFFQDGKSVGHLSFEGILSKHANFTIANNEVFELRYCGFLYTRIEIKQGEEIFFSSRRYRLNNFMIQNQKTGISFLLKRKPAFFKVIYVLQDNSGHVLSKITVHRGFSIRVKNLIFENEENFKLNKENLLLCAGVVFEIRRRLRRRRAAAR